MKELNFKQWLNEMAMVSRQKITLDQDDINYLKQFPIGPDWTRALKLRYNDLIYQSTIQGDLRSDWTDQQNITLSGNRGNKKTYTVNTGMSQLINKLKNYNFDLTGTNSTNKESLFYSPMQSTLAGKLIKNLISTIPSEEIERYKKAERSGQQNYKVLNQMLNPRPDVVEFSPNYLKSKRNDSEPGMENSESLRNEFVNKRKEISDIINISISHLNGMKQPNALYWLQNSDKLFDGLYEYIWMNWKDENFRDITKLPKIVHLKIRGYLQQGVISRRNYEGLKKIGLNTYDLLSQKNPSTGQNWSLDDIKKVVDQHKNHTDRYNAFLPNQMKNRAG